jgi:hypothetical protein
MPFSVEKPGFAVGPSIIRVWSNSFAPLGTPLVDTEDAAETLDNLFEGADGQRSATAADPRAARPAAERYLRSHGACRRHQPQPSDHDHQSLSAADAAERRGCAVYLGKAISSSHMREMRRQWRLLEEKGTVAYSVARQPHEIRTRFEEFLALEGGGWKGKRRSALVTDRYHTPPSPARRSPISQPSMRCVFTRIDLNGRAIASTVVLMMGGEAYTWKTAYDENTPAIPPASC